MNHSRRGRPGFVSVCGGEFNGRMLRVPDGMATRPARALVRRSVFDILQRRVANAAWLDLYSGSGAFGIEALSRGARCAWLVDSGAPSQECIRRNLEMLALTTPRAVLIEHDLPHWLLRSPPLGDGFDLISMDPPFAISRAVEPLRELVDALANAGRNGWFCAGALLIWEEPGSAPDPVPAGFTEADRRDHKTSRVRFLEFTGG